MQAADLPLRDIHPANAPPWWPPAPGWWLVVAGLLVAIGIVFALRLRRRRRARAIGRLFDEALAQAQTPAARIAAISELLRRAARRQHPDADKLHGDDWLRLLDQGLKQPVFAAGAGTVSGDGLLGNGLLGNGMFRRDVTDAEVESLRTAARARFLQWMGVQR